MTTEAITRADLRAKLAALGEITKDQRNDIVCSLLGHSDIVCYSFWRFLCGRCGDIVGDKLSGATGEKYVVIGCDCKKCRANFKKLDWRHKLYVPSPFKKD